MFVNRTLQVALVISLFIHGMVFLQMPGIIFPSSAPKDQKIEVRYIKEVKSLAKDRSNAQPQRSITKADPFLKLDSQIPTIKRAPPPYIEQSKAPKVPESFSEFPKPNFSTSDFMIIKKKITLPPIEMAKIDNPSYINYYQIVREKIRRSAYQNYSKNEIGEVYVSFVISNAGAIKAVHLIEEKTTANNYLRNIALRSVNEASPFPNFPKELDYPQLSFNIIISFEIE